MIFLHFPIKILNVDLWQISYGEKSGFCRFNINLGFISANQKIVTMLFTYILKLIVIIKMWHI